MYNGVVKSGGSMGSPTENSAILIDGSTTALILSNMIWSLPEQRFRRGRTAAESGLQRDAKHRLQERFRKQCPICAAHIVQFDPRIQANDPKGHGRLLLLRFRTVYKVRLHSSQFTSLPLPRSTCRAWNNAAQTRPNGGIFERDVVFRREAFERTRTTKPAWIALEVDGDRRLRHALRRRGIA